MPPDPRPTRRELLLAGAGTALGLLPTRANAIAPVATARSVVLVWLWGGPAQLDTWDPKPHAPAEFRGPFTTIPTQIAGVRFCELFPQLSRRTRTLSIVRALRSQSNDHGVAGTIGLTGSIAGATGLNGIPLPGTARPTIGSVVARVKAASGTPGRLPPFMVVGGKLHQGKKPIVGEGGGALGGMYDPFRLVHDPEGTRIPALQLPAGLTPERLGDRRRLLTSLDRLARSADTFGDYRTSAFEMLTSPAAGRAFDLSLETDATKRRYGLTRFGQSCLLGRRLVEHGVPFVQVNWSDHVESEEDAGDGGWDHHYRNFQLMQDRHAPWLDHSLSAFLDDLEERGLLNSTLVIAVGEFGRTPRINKDAGRDHWEHCYSALFAGGGVQGGRVVGASDARAERPADRPTTPADVIATVQRAIGLTSEQAQGLGVAVPGNSLEELF